MERKLPGEVSRFVRVLKQHLPVLAKRYKVKYMGVFGSYIRDKQKRTSDFDLLV